jgi:pimeloyl-ACP methyl ester carboxylesterase
VRRVILAGTAPAGGEGISNAGALLQDAIAKAGVENKHPKHLLFFRPSKNSQKAAGAFLSRLSERKEDRDAAVTNEAIHAQVVAITKWGMAAAGSLSGIRQPVLVVNGDNDIRVPTINSVELARNLPSAELSIFPDAGHGAIFQYHDMFIEQALRFLQANINARSSAMRRRELLKATAAAVVLGVGYPSKAAAQSKPKTQKERTMTAST